MKIVSWWWEWTFDDGGEGEGGEGEVEIWWREGKVYLGGFLLVGAMSKFSYWGDLGDRSRLFSNVCVCVRVRWEFCMCKDKDLNWERQRINSLHCEQNKE